MTQDTRYARSNQTSESGQVEHTSCAVVSGRKVSKWLGGWVQELLQRFSSFWRLCWLAVRQTGPQYRAHHYRIEIATAGVPTWLLTAVCRPNSTEPTCAARPVSVFRGASPDHDSPTCVGRQTYIGRPNTSRLAFASRMAIRGGKLAVADRARSRSRVPVR